MLSSSCQTPFWYDLLQNFSTTYIITNMQNVKEILDLMKSLAPQDGAVIEKAYMVAEKAHDGQKRFTGDPYVKHSFETAKNLAVFGMDRDTIIAGLLHDALEDGNITSEVIEKEFGKEVLFLVQGVTKLGKLKYQGVERHVESLRKMFIATALETLEIYAPLANRLGMGKLKGELEDEAFPYVYPEDYKRVKELLKERRGENEKYLEKFHRSLQKELAAQGMKNVHTDYRTKRLYSLHKKLKRKNNDIEKKNNITSLRIIVPTVEDCYKVLGIIHSAWR